jgi:hypothetical protein
MNHDLAIRFVPTRTYVTWLATGAALFFAVTAAVLAHESSASDASDAWRRTANGWELVTRWHEQPLRSDSTPPAFRLDSHPAALALLQSLTVVGAFALFPPHRFTAARATG